MVSIFAHGSFRHSLEKSIDRENVTFGSAYNVLGCQYQCVIVVLDISSCVPPTRNLVNAMTRATTSLHFIVNSVQTPMLINELPTFRCDPDCQEKEVEDRVRAQIPNVTAAGTKSYIVDGYKCLSNSFIDEMRDRAVTRRSKPWDTESKLRKDTNGFSRIVEIMPAGRPGGEMSNICQPPYAMIRFVPEPHQGGRYNFIDIRQRIIDFFASLN